MVDNRRDQLKEFVEREFIGPDPIEWEGLKQENGEEILISDPPRTRYIAGILFPKDSKETDNVEEEKEDEDVEIEDDVEQEKIITKNLMVSLMNILKTQKSLLIDQMHIINRR